MATAAPEEPKVDPSVVDFIKRHGAEADFQKVCELVRTCFPERRAIKVWLLEDPDEDGHTWVVLNVLLPGSHPPELLRVQQNRYHEGFVQQVSRPYHPLSFGLTVDFMAE
jgi:hypothetical protein